MKIFWTRKRQEAAQAAPNPVSEPVQAEEPTAEVVQLPDRRETPVRLSEAELFRLCELYGRAILIEICKNPSHFGFDSQNHSISNYYAQAAGMQRQFWEELQLENGNLENVADPAAPVWRVAAMLTQLDWAARGQKEAENG